MQQKEKYGVLLLGGHRTHQENYALNFAQDERCQLVAFADELDGPPERIRLARSLANELNLPFIADLDEALARKGCAYCQSLHGRRTARTYRGKVCGSRKACLS